MQVFKIFYSWQSDLPGNRTRYFIKDCIDEAIDLALSCETIEAEREEATTGITGSPNIVTSLFSKIDECDLFIADLSLCFTKESGIKKSPNPNVLLELGYAVKTLGWENIICICNSDYGDNYPFDIAHQRITAFSLEGKNKKEVKLELSKLIFKNIRDLRDGLPKTKQGMSSHVVGYYDSEKHDIVNTLIPQSLEKKDDYISRNKMILKKATSIFSEIMELNDQFKQKDVSNHVAIEQNLAITISDAQTKLAETVRKFSESYSPITSVVVIKEKELIKKRIEKWLNIQVSNDFFDLGNLKKATSFLNISGPTLDGTDDEKEKYHKICKLAYLLKLLDVRKKYLKTFEGICFIPVAIHNTSVVQDTNLSIILKVITGSPINPSSSLIFEEFDGFQGRFCRDDDDDSDIGIIAELFTLQEDGVIHAEEHTSLINHIRAPIPTLNGMTYPEKDEDDYEEELQEYIASTKGRDFYEFEISSLRPNEYRWLDKGMLIRPYDGKIQLSYLIHSDHTEGNITGLLTMNIN